MKKIFFAIFIIFSLVGSSYAASSSSDTKTTSNYDKAVKLIKFAKKYEKNGKVAVSYTHLTLPTIYSV